MDFGPTDICYIKIVSSRRNGASVTNIRPISLCGPEHYQQT